MHGKQAVYVFIVVLVVIFAFYNLGLETESTFIDPFDPNNEYIDYLESENPDTITYVVIGEIVGSSKDELTLSTGERFLTIKIPEATEYRALVSPVPHNVTELKYDQLVKAEVSVNKSTNEITGLIITVIGTYEDEEFSAPSQASVE